MPSRGPSDRSQQNSSGFGDIRRIATASIKWHRAGVSTLSFASGLPGGWWIAGTVPADLIQFFWHVLVILQKLAYLYGWPELFSEDSELDDETQTLQWLYGPIEGGNGITKATKRRSRRE